MNFSLLLHYSDIPHENNVIMCYLDKYSLHHVNLVLLLYDIFYIQRFLSFAKVNSY